eukprot:UN33969
MFENSVRKHGYMKCMGFRTFEGDEKTRGREFTYMNYKAVHKVCENLAQGLASLGLKKQDTVGIYSRNRAEWMQVHMANQRQGYQTVALYDTLGDEAVQYIFTHAELKVVFCEKHALNNVFGAIQKTEKSLVTHIVVFDHQKIYGNAHENIDDVKDIPDGVKLIGFSDLCAAGGESSCKAEKVSGDDVCFLMYTSGTTGRPKGVQLKHKGFLMITFGINSEIKLDHKDRHVSFLPLAHIFECLIETSLLDKGASIAYYQGNIKLLTSDWISVEPTLVVGVPRVFSKVYDKIMAGVAESGCIKKYFFNTAFAASAEKSRTGERVKKWDDKIWKNIAGKIGFSQVHSLLSGAAPLPPYLAEFLKIVLVKGKVGQGYGMTESTGGSTVQQQTDLNLSNVGIPVPGVSVRLQDIKEMSYLSSDKYPRGEILLSGDSIMKGYLKNEKATKTTLVNGWLHTGDVGRLNPNGTLSIIDRKKNIFKTSFGEYIAVEKVEGCYSKAASVNQLWVYGNSFKSFVVAVVVPDAQWVIGQIPMKNKNVKPGTTEFAIAFKE